MQVRRLNGSVGGLGNILISVKRDVGDAEQLLRMVRELRDKLDTDQILVIGEAWVFRVDNFEAVIFDRCHMKQAVTRLVT
jgi:hypothetical protein